MIFPIATDSVQLVSEHVLIRLRDPLDEGWVECSYTLKNLASSTQKFHMAFSPYGYLSDTTDYRHLNFEVISEEGQPLQVAFMEITDARWEPYVGYNAVSLPVWELTIAPDDSLKIRMSYLAIWSGEGPWGFSYNARPASLWAGVIEHAEITFEFTPFISLLLLNASNHGGPVHFSAKPEGGMWSGNRLRFVFSDWEPSEDVSIDVTPIDE